MPDDKRGRDKQAHDEERRQREWEANEAIDRADEPEPPIEDRDDSPDNDQDDAIETRRGEGESPSSTPECHRRDCAEPAEFLVLERYQEETGQGAVEAIAYLCREHTAEESPTNLDGAYPDYVFRVEPIPETDDSESA